MEVEVVEGCSQDDKLIIVTKEVSNGMCILKVSQFLILLKNKLRVNM